MRKPGSAGLTADKLGDSDMWVAKDTSNEVLSSKGRELAPESGKSGVSTI